MKILAITSSPRRSGNSELLLDELIRGAKDNGSDVEKYALADLIIHPCNQCDFCHSRGQCNIKDDMEMLYAKLLETDTLVLASPIYFMAHCAQAKLFIDRCQVLWARRYILKQKLIPAGRPPRRGIFIAVGATHGEKVFAGVKVTMKWFFDALQMEYYEDLLIEGVDKKGAIREHPSALPEAYALGAKLAKLP
jgi:multimeric flavodoxin WrbA